MTADFAFPPAFALILAGAGSTNGFIDDAVQLFQHLGHVRCVAAFLKLLVDGLQIIMANRKDSSGFVRNESLKPDKDLPHHDLESSSSLVP